MKGFVRFCSAVLAVLMLSQTASGFISDISKQQEPPVSQEEEYKMKETELVSIAISELIARYGKGEFRIVSSDMVISDSILDALLNEEPKITGLLFKVSTAYMTDRTFDVIVNIDGNLVRDSFLPVYYSAKYGISTEPNSYFGYDIDFLIALYCEYHYPYYDYDYDEEGNRQINFKREAHHYYCPEDVSFSLIPHKGRIYSIREIASWLEKEYCSNRKKNPKIADYDDIVYNWLFSEETISRLNSHHESTNDEVLDNIRADFEKMIRNYK